MTRSLELPIRIRLQSRYRVFDQSGRLPFSIVFGLCRAAPIDRDPRPILISTKNSALDVPYALAHKLLTLHELDSETKQETEVDLSHLRSDEDNTCYVVLSSPVRRTRPTRESYVMYHYTISVDSDLSRALHPHKSYIIRMPNRHVGIDWYAYGECDQELSGTDVTLPPIEAQKFVCNRGSRGKARFKVLASLPQPPKVTVQMRLSSTDGTSPQLETHKSDETIEFSITNTGDWTYSIQAAGIQHYLEPWAAFQPEEPGEDTRPQILDSSEGALAMNLRVLNTLTGIMMRETRRPRVCTLRDSNADLRPKLSAMVKLKRGEQVKRSIRVTDLAKGLPDGDYEVQLQSRGAWWCQGDVNKASKPGDDRVHHGIYDTAIPPLMLESNDVVKFRLCGGAITRLT